MGLVCVYRCNCVQNKSKVNFKTTKQQAIKVSQHGKIRKLMSELQIALFIGHLRQLTETLNTTHTCYQHFVITYHAYSSNKNAPTNPLSFKVAGE